MRFILLPVITKETGKTINVIISKESVVFIEPTNKEFLERTDTKNIIDKFTYGEEVIKDKYPDEVCSSINLVVGATRIVLYSCESVETLLEKLNQE